MSDTGLRWTSWARRLRRRWAQRRAERTGLEFVWLRLHRSARSDGPRVHSIAQTINVRLAVHVPIVTRMVPTLTWARPFSCTPGLHHPTRQPPHHVPFAMAPVRSMQSRWSTNSTSTSVWMSPRMVSRQWLRGTTVVTRTMLHWTAGRTATLLQPARGRVDVPVGGRVEAAMRTLISASTIRVRSGRREVCVVAPPPMVPRAARRDAGGRGPAAATQEGQPPLARAVDSRGIWSMAAPGAAAISSPPVSLAALTEQVMRQINDRVRAKRERLGKV